MRKVIAAINMTLDGVCDHTIGIVDERLHQHYADLIDSGGVILYGRTTFELMKFWQNLLQHPSGEKSMDDFARSIDNIPKLVFSTTLKETGWDSATISDKSPKEEIIERRQEAGKDMLIGSRSLIIELLNDELVDEFQICIHPIIAGKGLPLFNQIKEQISLKLLNTKVLDSGVTIFYYQPIRNKK